MESTSRSLKINYTIFTRIVRVEEVFERKHISGFGETALFDKVSQGWIVLFDGSYEALNFGHTKPELEAGDTIKITIEKVDA